MITVMPTLAFQINVLRCSSLSGVQEYAQTGAANLGGVMGSDSETTSGGMPLPVSGSSSGSILLHSGAQNFSLGRWLQGIAGRFDGPLKMFIQLGINGMGCRPVTG
jgi:hypothetical protein